MEADVNFGRFREYRLKFYLNAQHYVIFDGKKGETHPHTWEFCLGIKTPADKVIAFSTYERGIATYLKDYQNTVLNEKAPFDTIMPTLEGIMEVFKLDFYRIVKECGGSLIYAEGSEGPTRTYIARVVAESLPAQEDDHLISGLISSIANATARE